MSLANYTDLKASLTAWLRRTDLTAVIPDFISLAETKLARNLFDKSKFRLPPRDTEEIASGTTSGAEIALPVGYKGTEYFKLSQNSAELTLDYVSPDQMDRFSGSPSTPAVYTISGNNLIIGPEPATNYDYEWKRSVSFAPLSEANATNWLLLAAPDLYLYSALAESAPYLKDDARIATWLNGYEIKLNEYAASVYTERMPDGPVRMRSARTA